MTLYLIYWTISVELRFLNYAQNRPFSNCLLLQIKRFKHGWKQHFGQSSLHCKLLLVALFIWLGFRMRLFGKPWRKTGASSRIRSSRWRSWYRCSSNKLWSCLQLKAFQHEHMLSEVRPSELVHPHGLFTNDPYQPVLNSATVACYFHPLSFVDPMCFLTLTTQVSMKLMTQHSEHLLMNHHALPPLPALSHKLI